MKWIKNITNTANVITGMRGSYTVSPGEIVLGQAVESQGGGPSWRTVKLPEEIQRVSELVVVRRTMLGDVLVAQAALRAIRDKYGLDRVVLLTSTRNREFLSQCQGYGPGFYVADAPQRVGNFDPSYTMVVNWDGVFEQDHHLRDGRSRAQMVLEAFGVGNE